MEKVKNVKNLRGFLKGMNTEVEREIGIASPEVKNIVKEAIAEIFKSKPELLENAVRDVLEDMALIKAIKEGDKKDYVNYDELMKVMDKKIKDSK